MPNLHSVGADPTPPVDLAQAELLADELNIAIRTRHDATHSRFRTIENCTDPVCDAWLRLSRAVSL